MKNLAKILLTAAVATNSFAMRADDLSELVAAVAIGKNSAAQQISRDALVADFDTLPVYKPANKGEKNSDVNLAFLEGIEDAMVVNASLDFMLRNYGATGFDERTREYHYDQSYPFRYSLAGIDFYRPVPGQITSNYGWREQFQRQHKGVDLQLNVGDTVRAAISGTVTKVAFDKDGFGHYVKLQHADGMETLYGHLKCATVEIGQEILSGEAIGLGGNTGNSTGPHLHFEVRIGGEAVNPLTLFDFDIPGYYADYLSPVHQEDSSIDAKKPLAGRRTYVVKYGDTPKSVASKAGISLSKLCQLNMIKTTDQLQVGRMIKLK